MLGLYYRRRLLKEKQYTVRLQELIFEREQAEAALGKIRQDIARDYHDELGNHLASITVLSSMAKKYFRDGKEETPKVLDKIADSSKQLHAITRDFLWSIEGKWHSLDELIIYLADKGNAFFEPLDIEFSLIKDETKDFLPSLPKPFNPTNNQFKSLVKFNNVTVSYGDRTIVNNINWEIKSGEFWQLTGPNGSGKSTLLSLISGDNPKAYNQDIILFGVKKGSGESVWDIKKKIGYFSSEFLRGFARLHSIENMIISGFFDSVLPSFLLRLN